MDHAFGPAMAAMYAGDLEGLAALLRADPGLARRRSSCSHPTLLQLVACEETKVPNPAQVTCMLADAGAPTDEPFVAAAGCEGWEVMRTLLARGVAVDRPDAWSALDEALYWDHTKVAAFLLERGAQVRSLRAAAALGLAQELDAYFIDGTLTADAGPIRSPFSDTIGPGTADDPRHILDNAFVSAINSGQQVTAAVLLDHGARVNATPPGFHWRGTALHAAVWRASRAPRTSTLVEWLLSVGADPRVRDGMVHADAAGWAAHHGLPELEARLRSVAP